MFRPLMPPAALLALPILAAPAAGSDKIHVHGYGEVHSNNDLAGDRKLDVHRTVIGVKAQLAPNAFFNTEVDFEHAFKEPELEFAYVDWVLTPRFTLRVGDMLMPVGPLNEFHEPPLFLSVERPYLHNKIIPTTWQEIGLGAVVSLPEAGLNLRAYAVNGLKGSAIIAEGGSKGIRSARYKGIDVLAEDFAGVLRVEYGGMKGLALGASGYLGGADQKSHADSQIVVGLYAADAKYRIAGVEIGVQGALGTLSGTYFTEALGLDEGKLMWGALGEISYSFEGLIGDGSRLAPFFRYERLDLDARTQGANAGEQLLTPGLAFFPNPNLAFKADTEFWTAEKNAYTEKSGRVNDRKVVVNFGVGVMF